MWKLTIVQKRTPDGASYPIKEKATFTNKELQPLLAIIEQFANCDEAYETEYRIERMGEDDGI